MSDQPESTVGTGPPPVPRTDRGLVALGYMVALSSSAGALYLSLVLESRIGDGSFAVLFAAIMLSAWYGGLGPGLIATVLCGLAIDYYFEAPLYSLRVSSVATALRLGVFVLVAVFIASLSARLRSAYAAADAARRQAEHSAAIVASSQDAIVGVDLGGRITGWNDGAARIFGYEAGDAVGQPLAVLQPGDRPADLVRVVERLASGERFGVFVTSGLRRDGRGVEVVVTMAPIRNALGEVVGASTVTRAGAALAHEHELAELAALVARESDAGRALGAALEAARRLLAADTAAFLRWDAARGGLVPARGSPPTGDTTLSAPGEGAAGRAVQARRTVLMNDYANQAGATEGAIRAGVRAAIASPVLHRGELVGALAVGSLAPSARFAESDADLLELLAGLVSAALASVEPRST
jgi:PAS domain S-box-containing protein